MKKQENEKKHNKFNPKKFFSDIRYNYSNLNILLLIFMIFYAIFGLVMILSASSIAAVLRYQVPTNYFFYKQLLFVSVSFIVGLFFIIHVPTHSYYRVSKVGIWIVIFLLCFLFFRGITAGGARSWFDLGTFNAQPAEIAKLALIIYFAWYFNKLNTHGKICLFDMLKPLLIAGLTFILVAAQPDLGGALIILFITLLIFLSLPIAKKHKRTIYMIGGIGMVLVGLICLLFGQKLLSSYQVSRIVNYRNPCERYTENSGFQVCNGYIAIHNGGLFGVGLGQSTQKYLYLPEAHTDFIFPIICEELGVVVGIVVVLGYMVMLLIILNIAKSTSTLRNSILAYGIFAYLLLHIVINLLGVLGLMPLTGVPLPFLSYGGSYNICVIISLFIVQRINIENKKDSVLKKIEKL